MIKQPDIRPRRSVLFMPGSNPRAMRNARTLPADALVFDLEDAVAPTAKADARQQVATTLAAGGFGARELIVRVNALDTEWGNADLETVASTKADAVLLPKVETAGQVHAALAILDAAGGTEMPMWIMIETPVGVMNAALLAAASQRLRCVVLGTSDLSRDLRLPTDDVRLGLLAPLSWCVTAARASGLDVLDGVHLDINDAAVFQRLCLQGRQLGFDGKTLIHPTQISAANEIFGPSEEDVAAAEKIIAAWHQATRDGKGITVVGGRLVENLHVDEARRTLKLRDAINARQSPA